jgi:pyridoxamine 5'-phosphate oxidase
MHNFIRELQNKRVDFSKQTLDETMVDKNPLVQFDLWFQEAVQARVHMPDAMVVSTCTKEGFPSARILLLRNCDENGFVFYTNYQSRKGQNLLENPRAAITFFWPELERQVRIEGPVEKQTPQVSDEYFAMRPDGSKLGAWSSEQSAVVKNRAALDQKFEESRQLFHNKEIPRPPFWGGYNLRPVMYEFWQGRPNRFHDRIAYSLSVEGNWKIERLSP